MLILEGLFRKIVIADNCALMANAAFDGHLGSSSLATIIIGVLAFSFQIYGDFSGYSNIARGSAQLIGLHFQINFKQPYFSTSLQEFWRRWHMSLSTWLRDYLYIGLGGNRHGSFKTYRNLFLTMVIGGFWHGANWTFIVWGFIHGGGLAIERYFKWDKPVQGLIGFVKGCLIFAIDGFAWIFFRANSVAEAWRFLTGISNLSLTGNQLSALEFLSLFIVPMLALDWVLEKKCQETFFDFKGLSWRVAFGGVLIILTLLFGANQTNAFIYFQF